MEIIFYIACVYLVSGIVFAVSCYFAPLVDDAGRIVEERGVRDPLKSTAPRESHQQQATV